MIRNNEEQRDSMWRKGFDFTLTCAPCDTVFTWVQDVMLALQMQNKVRRACEGLEGRVCALDLFSFSLQDSRHSGKPKAVSVQPAGFVISISKKTFIDSFHLSPKWQIIKEINVQQKQCKKASINI